MKLVWRVLLPKLLLSSMWTTVTTGYCVFNTSEWVTWCLLVENQEYQDMAYMKWKKSFFMNSIHFSTIIHDPSIARWCHTSYLHQPLYKALSLICCFCFTCRQKSLRRNGELRRVMTKVNNFAVRNECVSEARLVVRKYSHLCLYVLSSPSSSASSLLPRFCQHTTPALLRHHHSRSETGPAKGRRGTDNSVDRSYDPEGIHFFFLQSCSEHSAVP